MIPLIFIISYIAVGIGIVRCSLKYISAFRDWIWDWGPEDGRFICASAALTWIFWIPFLAVILLVGLVLIGISKLCGPND